jgi:polyphosphate kinase 2 (PPK2 family)
MWRFWTDLPAAGQWAIFDRSWYGRVLADRVEGEVSHEQCCQAYQDIRQFEQGLSDSGAVLVKFWLHISKREQKRRFRRLRASRATAWRVGKPERRQHRQYDEWVQAIEEMLAPTSTGPAPWTIVAASQARLARVAVFRAVVEAVRAELARRKPPSPPAPLPIVPQRHAGEGSEGAPAPGAQAGEPSDGPSPPAPLPKGEGSESAPAAPRAAILARVDLSLSLDRAQYEQQLGELQKRLFKAEHELYTARVPAVIAYEGWDAGGKGGNIKRLTRGLDPRGYEVVPIAAPTAEEKARPYLWRFWREIPKAGHITIFDRTWYGRVLVERVEGFATEAEWRRAYDEINAFERQLLDFGTVLVKFWLEIDAQEQLRRFQEREAMPFKRWKITAEDWRNREKRKFYEPAVAEMLERTSTPAAPWTILEANCKLYARIKALRTVAEALEAAVKRRT